MKKINLMIFAVLAGAMAFMTSCDGDDETFTPKPVIEFTSDHSGVVMAGDTVDVVGNVTAEGSLAKITFFKGDDQYGDAITDDFNTKTSHTFSVKVVGDETFDFEVQVEDKEGQISKKSVTITVDESIVKSTTAIKLFTAPADQSGDEARFTSLTPDFATYSWSTAQGNEATIDLMYYNSNWEKGTSNPHFISPDTKTIAYPLHNDQVLTGANATYFAVLEGDDAALFTDWDNINDDTAINSIAATIVDKNVTWTTGAGTIIAFELSDGKKGVIKVGNAVDGNGNTEYWDAAYDYIEFDVIVQKHAPSTK